MICSSYFSPPPSPASPAAGLTAGAATADITPPLGTPMAGYYSARGAEGVHDPLFAKALVLEKDGTKAALVSLDLISTTRGARRGGPRVIEKETGIPGRNVMISATHAHTGPVLRDGAPRGDALGGGNPTGRALHARSCPARSPRPCEGRRGARRPAKVVVRARPGGRRSRSTAGST